MTAEITLYEYDHISAFPSETRAQGVTRVSEECLGALEAFVGSLNASDETKGRELNEVLRLSSRNGIRTLQVRNFVGVISAGNTTLEILPKIGRNVGEEETRSTFLAMLSSLLNLPYKTLGQAKLREQKATLLEVFISAFLDEIEIVLRRGIRSDYLRQQSNEQFVKGRICFPEHLRHNPVDASRVFVEYSRYHVDRPENRLLKSALLLSESRSRSTLNRHRIRIALDHLNDVSESIDVRGDSAACKSDRNLAHYEKALAWSRLILAEKAPMPFPGIFTADALLFPMERIFEAHVASRLGVVGRSLGLRVNAQERERRLFESHNGYSLRPDIVVRGGNGLPVILDTKWKIPRDNKPSQADMYQMLAYAVKYGVSDVVLVYPLLSGESHLCDTYTTEKVMDADRPIRIHTFQYALPSRAGASDEGAKSLASLCDTFLHDSPTKLASANEQAR